MEVYTIDYTQDYSSLSPSVCCIGYFDGLHTGHQALINKCKEVSKIKDLKCGLITFDPDPWKIFFPDRPLRHITSLKDRINLAESMGIEVIYVITFSKSFAALSIDCFHDLLSSMKVQHLVCGFDFKYASKNIGNVDTLKKQSKFEVSVIESVDSDNEKISSSRIEPFICSGKIEKANQLLGYLYSIQGKVVHGFQRGSSLLNIPTANLASQSEYLLPSSGVYAGFVLVDSTLYGAMINVGNNPTFENEEVTVEANIFDFDKDIYDKEVRFFFLCKTRSEIKFNSFEELKKQLQSDVRTCKNAIQNNPYLLKKTCQLWKSNYFEFHTKF